MIIDNTNTLFAPRIRRVIHIHMKIPQNLPQFNEESTLIVVSGKSSADIYLGFKGDIRNIDVISEESNDKVYSPNGMFTISVSDRRKRKRYLKKIDSTILEVLAVHKVHSVYLFAPSYIMRDLWDTLSVSVRKCIKLAIRGNYYNGHIYEALQKIYDIKSKERENIEEWRVILKPETQQIIGTGTISSARNTTLSSLLRY